MKLRWMLPLFALVTAAAAELADDEGQTILDPVTNDDCQTPIFPEPKACKMMKRVRCSKYRLPPNDVECPCSA